MKQTPLFEEKACRSGERAHICLRANGAQAYQPRATALGKASHNPNPPCKGGSSGLGPFRAPDCNEGPAFPGFYPGLICWRAFSAGSYEYLLLCDLTKHPG